MNADYKKYALEYESATGISTAECDSNGFQR